MTLYHILLRRSEMSVYFFTEMKGESNIMKKIMKRLLTGVFTLATVFTTLPVTHRFMLRILSKPLRTVKQE